MKNLTLNKKVYTFLTFKGNTEEALNFYVSVFPGAKITSITHISKGDPGIEGKVLNAIIEIGGQQIMAMDLVQEQTPGFTWATSLLFNCDSEAEFDKVFAKLSENGFVMMGPEPVKSKNISITKATWVIDKFGLTWQLVFI